MRTSRLQLAVSVAFLASTDGAYLRNTFIRAPASSSSVVRCSGRMLLHCEARTIISESYCGFLLEDVFAKSGHMLFQMSYWSLWHKTCLFFNLFCLTFPTSLSPLLSLAAFQASRPNVVQRQPLSALSMSSNANELVSVELSSGGT